MPKRSTVRLLLLIPVLGVVLGILLLLRPAPGAPGGDCEPAGRPPRIRPDYTGTVIPPNIAPLNFEVQEPGEAFCARICGAQGDPVEVISRSSAIQIPLRSWRDLLDKNRGRTLRVEVFVRDDAGRWRRFESITNLIAAEDIDHSLVYRRMHYMHVRAGSRIEICRRDLGTFKESVVLSSAGFENGCVNCHTFCRNRADTMLLGVRSEQYGTATLLVADGEVRKLDRKFGYASWHPSGRLAVYAVNEIPMFYHEARNEARDTIDMDSMLAIYRREGHRIAVEPKLARKEYLETWPVWSGDGKHLYFCLAPKSWPAGTAVPPPGYDRIRYDLVRIAYDVETDAWGEIETVLAAERTGKSVGMPRISPDGRWLCFCLFDHGYFPTWKQESDLYLMDLQASPQDGQLPYRCLDINSDQSESWLTWSSNSRWIVFSSKRLHGVLTRLFISYVDSEGKAHKPLLLPQKDPAFYESCLWVFNTPELVIGRPQASGETLARAFRRRDGTAVSIPATMATPIARPAPSAGAWQVQHE